MAVLLEGEMIFELEGEPERVIKASERSGSRAGVNHYQGPNNLAGAWTRFVVVMMMGVPGELMLTLVDEADSRPGGICGRRGNPAKLT